MKLNRPIGSVVCLILLFICSTTFANNKHNKVASKLMQTQNCSFDINNYTLSYDNVEALRAQQLETIRNVQKITKDSANRLIQVSPNFETLLLTLRSGIRFGGGFYTSDEDIQLGTGPLNYRKSIHTTGDVLARFGQELNKIAEKFQVQAVLNVQMVEWNEIVNSVDSLVRMFQRDLPIAFTVMHGFGPNTFLDSVEQLASLADGLIGLANKWKAQLLRQKQSCERYLQDTFDTQGVKTPSIDPLALELEAFGEHILNDSIHSNQLFVSRIAAIVKLPKSTEKTDQYAKMLKYLSTATLDMFHYLKSSSSSAESSRAPIYDHDSFMYYVKKVKNTFNAQLERHLSEHDKQLANIIAKMNQSAKFNRTSDVPHHLLVAKVLETAIQSKFVLQQYDSVVVALKQLVFPYAHLYLADADFNRNSSDIEYLVNSAVESLDTMRPRKYASYTVTQGFHSDYPCAPPPFYVWSNASAHALSKLLSGGSVNLKAHIRLTDPEMDAIKFRKVRFNLKANNPALQQELDTSLEYFRITARHMGDSYYRYAGKYYSIKHEPLEISYSFRKESDGTPTTRNEIFIKLKEESTYTLSPYAMWQIQLHPMKPAISFDWLAKFKGQVYLELVGRGQFVESKKGVDDDDLHLEKYYTEYCPVENIIAETADHESQQNFYIMKCRMSR